MAEDKLWLFDAVTGFLRGPEWAVPVWNFIDDNCIVFDSEEENKLAHIDIFNAFREMVESLLEMHLSDVGCSMEEFVELCEAYSTTEVGRDVLEQILAVDDYVSFKKMMVKRNMELELESMKQLQALSENVQDGGGIEPEEPAEDDFEAQLQQALALSIKEMQDSGMATDFAPDELLKQQEDAEEADLRMALALSLQLDQQQEEMAAEGKPLPAEPPPPAARPAPAAPPPVERRPPPAAVSRPPPQASLAPIVRREPPQRSEQQQAAAERAVEVARNAAIRAQEVREQEELSRAAVEPSAPPSMPGVSQAEMRARAEHLKKQRDLILAQRKKQREEQLGAPAEQVTPAPGELASAPPPQARAGGGAGYSSGAPSGGGGGDSQRANLSRTLASSMKASLLGEDAQTLDLNHRIEQHHKKIDLELTKAQLRDEVARNGALP